MEAGDCAPGTTVSGVNDLVTGRLAGSSAGVHDIDAGITSVQSPAITLPSNNPAMAVALATEVLEGRGATVGEAFVRAKERFLAMMNGTAEFTIPDQPKDANGSF